MIDHIKLRREDWEKIQTELLELKHQSHHFIYEEMWRIDRVLSIKPVEELEDNPNDKCFACKIIRRIHQSEGCHEFVEPLREEDGE